MSLNVHGYILNDEVLCKMLTAAADGANVSIRDGIAYIGKQAIGRAISERKEDILPLQSNTAYAAKLRALGFKGDTLPSDSERRITSELLDGMQD